MGYLSVYSIYYFCFITTLTLSSIDLSLFVKSIVKRSFSSVELFFFKKQLLGTIGLTKRRPRNTNIATGVYIFLQNASLKRVFSLI